MNVLVAVSSRNSTSSEITGTNMNKPSKCALHTTLMSWRDCSMLQTHNFTLRMYTISVCSNSTGIYS